MKSRSRKASVYPLQFLAEAVCDQCRLFPNRTAMFQLLTVFLYDRDLRFTSEGLNTTDRLIPLIQDYLRNYTPENSETEQMRHLHFLVFQNLSGSEYGCAPYTLSSDYLGSVSSKDSGYLNRGTLPRDYRNAIRFSSSGQAMTRRLFWILQYYIVYYLCMSEKHHDAVIFNGSTSRDSDCFPEYWSLSESFSERLFTSLKEKCGPYSGRLHDLSDWKEMNLLQLSTVFLEILYSHYCGTYLTAEDTSNAPAFSSSAQNSERQLQDFQAFIDCYPKGSYDRFLCLKKWEKKNFYAASELGDLYFHGASLHIGTGNSYEIDYDYSKAAGFYHTAIRLSSPPYSYACWSYADILVKSYINSAGKETGYLERAADYLQKAGNYAPALNLLGRISCLRAEHIAISSGKQKLPSDAVQLFIDFLNLSSEAASMGWYYADSRIAAFLLDCPKKYPTLLSTIKQADYSSLLHANLNIEWHLKKAANCGSLWAMNRLAEYYIQNGDEASAEIWLRKACDMNYARAFYTWAEKLPLSSKEREQKLLRASALSYPQASLQLAENHLRLNNRGKALRYLDLATVQLSAWRQQDSSLWNRIFDLRKHLL